jgi:AbrB family looped-hinge helix DNA binding protein
MKVTIKGQVTIPKEVREKLDIHPLSEVDFVEEQGGCSWSRKSLEGGIKRGLPRFVGAPRRG